MYIKRGVIFHSISRRGEIVGVVVLTREYGCAGYRRWRPSPYFLQGRNRVKM